MELDRLGFIGSLRTGRDGYLHVVQAPQRTHDRPGDPGCEPGGFAAAADRAPDVTGSVLQERRSLSRVIER